MQTIWTEQHSILKTNIRYQFYIAAFLVLLAIITTGYLFFVKQSSSADAQSDIFDLNEPDSINLSQINEKEIKDPLLKMMALAKKAAAKNKVSKNIPPKYIEHLIEKGETISKILGALQVPYGEMLKIIEIAKPIFVLTKIKEGKRLGIYLDAVDNTLTRLDYELSTVDHLSLERVKDGFIAKKVDQPFSPNSIQKQTNPPIEKTASAPMVVQK